MKPLLIFSLIMLAACGCGNDHSTISAKSDKIIIRTIEDEGDNSYGRYKYTFDHADLVFYTDSLFKIGDELKLKR